jgi:iron complex outermembrane recepter protein
MKNLFLFLGLLLITNSLLAQSILNGTVKDDIKKESIEFASIAVYSGLDSSLVGGNISDINGNFSVGNLPDGSLFVKVSFLGFKSKLIGGIQLAENEKKDMGVILLTSDLQNLSSVDVQGQRISTAFKTEKKSFSAETFESAIGGTATDVLRNLPGVSINAEGQLAIRGNVGFMIMINGRPLQGDPAAILAQLPANAIEKIEWISSPTAQYDSEGKTGIINITTVQGITDGMYVQVNGRYGLPSIQNYDNAQGQKRYGSDFNLNYVKGKWNISFGAGYQRNDQSGRRDGNVITFRGDTSTHFPSNGERILKNII